MKYCDVVLEITVAFGWKHYQHNDMAIGRCRDKKKKKQTELKLKHLQLFRYFKKKLFFFLSCS